MSFSNLPGFMWTENILPGVFKFLRFQMYPGQCGRGLSNWALSIRPKIPEISGQERMVQKFPGKVPENPQSVDFPKCEPFNRKSPKFQEQNLMELKFPGNCFRKFGSSFRGCPLIWIFWENRHFTLSPSSFGREFSEFGS